MKRTSALAAASGLMLAASALAQFSGNGIPTVFLPADQGIAAMTVAYHPGFKQYYGSGGGSPSNPGYVWSSSGTLLQGGGYGNPVGIDVRAWNWNPNTNQLEILPYGVQGGVYALSTPNLDGSGFLTGSNTSLLGSMPGIPDYQTSAAYDPSRDVYQARETGGNVVRQVSRSTGNQTGSVSLDFGAAGINAGMLNEYNVSYDPAHDLLAVQDYSASPDVVYMFHATNGSFAGSNTLAADTPYPYYNGSFSNGQYFQWTDTGWQGYKLSNVPGPASAGLLGLSGLVAARRRRTS